jgi:transcriptional regulator with XRE-family HTH domain
MSKELRSAEFLWADQSGYNKLDEVLFEDLPENGWLKTCREALLLSQAEMASRLKISKQGYAKLEENEINSTVSIANMQKAAEAMGCEFVYRVRPKNRRKFSEIVWAQILPQAMKVYKFRMRTQKLKPLVLARIALNLLSDPVFAREMKWSRTKSITKS